MTYRNNELDFIPKALDTYDDAEEDVVVVDSFRTFLKKAIATANRSSAFIRNLDFLSIGALPTATRCTLIFIDCIVGVGVVVLVLDVDNSFNGTESFSGTLSICCIIVLPGATGASSSGILLFTGDGSDDIAVTSPSPDVKPVVVMSPSSGIVVIMIFYVDAMCRWS